MSSINIRVFRSNFSLSKNVWSCCKSSFENFSNAEQHRMKMKLWTNSYSLRSQELVCRWTLSKLCFKRRNVLSQVQTWHANNKILFETLKITTSFHTKPRCCLFQTCKLHLQRHWHLSCSILNGLVTLLINRISLRKWFSSFASF